MTSPTVVGYTPDRATVELDYTAINEDVTETVIYKPAEVSFTVKHYQQNTDNDNYTLADTETRTGYTESVVGAGLAKTYEGFTALLYDTTTKIAADGSTEVEIYYDRNYYLLNLDLAGGWGADPIYARYGAVISLSSPTKSGYTFAGWTPEAPANMPAENKTLKANWTAKDSVDYTVVFWYQNANDDGYSYAGSITQSATPGASKSSDDFRSTDFTGRDASHFTYNAAKAETATINGDGSTVVNVYFTRNTYTLTFKDGKTTVKTINARYQQDIHGNFPIKDGSDTIWWNVPNGCKSFKPGTQLGSIDIMPGENITFTKDDSQSGAMLYYYVETLNGEKGDYTHNGKNFKQYKQITLDKYCYLTYSEEFHDITGFTQWWSDPAFDKMEQGGVAYDGYSRNRGYYIKDVNVLCYTRNSYTLKFYNYGTELTDHQATLQYEAPLKDKNFTPAYPSNLEANAYEFAGWYTTPGCYEGSEVNWDTATMPAGDLMLYAKWTPKTHTVRTFLTEEAMSAAENPTNIWEKVAHRSIIADKPEDPTNGNYNFVGWFYKENGVEKAYDFSMAVTKDMDLYAKWISNSLVQYTIHYQLENGTPIAPDTTGSALAGATKTFDAKTGADLNQGYQTGYFPKVGSHSITMDINGGNEYTFVYVPKAEVNYTVRYLEKDTNTVLHEEKHAATRDAVVTEKFVTITEYAPDAYQKRLVLSADEGSNVITFWYVKDTEHAPVQIIHWVQNIAGDGYTEYSSSTNLNGLIGETYTAEWLTIAGFAKNETKSNISGVLTNQGLVLNLYYDRIEYPYEFRFVNSYTGEEITGYDFGTTNGNARFGDRVTYTAPERLGALGYKLDTAKSSASQAIDIRIEDPANVAKLNVKTFYYIPYFNVVHVQRDPATENVTRTPNEVDLTVSIAENGYDLTAQVAAGYLYGGSFSNEACTEVQGYGTENPTSFTPTRGQTYYIWEVPDTYLRPSNYRVARHIDGVQTLCKLYPLTTADRLLYKEVGFSAYFGNDTASVVDIKSGSNNAEFEPPVANPGAATVYQMVKAARNGKVETTVYVMDGKLSSVNADITDGTANGKPIDPGYIGGARLTDDQFAQFKTDGITYTPYWITLDGVKVTGTMQRNLTFDASKPNVAQIKKIPVATTCTYVEDTPAVRLLNFATAFNMDDSQTTVDTRITVTVQDGASTYTTKVQPGDPVELTPNGQDGKLFAGWYVDGKASDLSGFTADTTVVAKYVDGSYLDLDYSRIGLFRVRGVTLISAVDDEDNYQEVGIMVNGEPVSSVRFASRYMLFNTPSSMFGVARGSRFVIADQSLYGSGALEVTPYWITMDGTTVLGQSHTLHYTSRSIWE